MNLDIAVRCVDARLRMLSNTFSVNEAWQTIRAAVPSEAQLAQATNRRSRDIAQEVVRACQEYALSKKVATALAAILTVRLSGVR